MKKKLLSLLLALGLVASLAACGGGDDAKTPGTDSPGPSQSQGGEGMANREGYYFQSGAAAFSIDDDMATVLQALGEEQSYFEAESCAFEGLDKTYTYPGFVITTRPDGEKDYVNSIRLTDDSISTVEGVYIGQGEADVKAAYGEEGGEQTGVLTYTKGGVALQFLLENGVVTSIEYLPG